MTIETELPAVKVKAWIDAHLSKMAMLPKRVDEMNEDEAAIFQIVAYHTGFLQFLSSSLKDDPGNGRDGEDNQPRYTTKRLRDEIAKAKAYARREALEEAAKVAETARISGSLVRPGVAAAIRALISKKMEG